VVEPAARVFGPRGVDDLELRSGGEADVALAPAPVLVEAEVEAAAGRAVPREAAFRPRRRPARLGRAGERLEAVGDLGLDPVRLAGRTAGRQRKGGEDGSSYPKNVFAAS
jgi:hypothetical protein